MASSLINPFENSSSGCYRHPSTNSDTFKTSKEKVNRFHEDFGYESYELLFSLG